MEDRDSRSILVGDADRNSTQTIVALQQSLGLIVTAVQTGAEVLAQVDRACPALVLLAADLPEPSAYEVLRQLRERFGDRLPIVVLSACRGEPRDEIASLLLGADDYFDKPLEGDRLIARVRRLLRRSNMSTAPAQPMTAAGRNHLTGRELQVLRLLVDGLRSAEIAQKLCITRPSLPTSSTSSPSSTLTVRHRPSRSRFGTGCFRARPSTPKQLPTSAPNLRPSTRPVGSVISTRP